jgi:hypothetical protein
MFSLAVFKRSWVSSSIWISMFFPALQSSKHHNSQLPANLSNSARKDSAQLWEWREFWMWINTSRTLVKVHGAWGQQKQPGLKGNQGGDKAPTFPLFWDL